MFLHNLHLNPRNKEARRDLTDPYELHSTLCRAFSPTGQKCPEGEFLWRFEGGSVPSEPCLLVQSRSLPDWSRIGLKDWFAKQPSDPVNLAERLNINSFQTGMRFRFRLRANPCVTRNGKRLGLLKPEEQELWLERKGREQHGFSLPTLSRQETTLIDVMVSQARMIGGRKRNGSEIRVFSVLYDGFLSVTDPEKFRSALQSGIGHGKAMGLGLLSIAPSR